MKYKVAEKEDGIDISVDDVKDNKEKLLVAFQECQAGHCSCPTEEYKKLDSLEVEQKGESIRLHLKSKHGEKIDMSEINRCLEYTTERVEKESGK